MDLLELFTPAAIDFWLGSLMLSGLNLFAVAFVNIWYSIIFDADANVLVGLKLFGYCKSFHREEDSRKQHG